MARAFTRARDDPPSGDLSRRGWREQLRHGDIQTRGQFLERIIGGRHLPVFDLGQGRARETRLPRRLFECQAQILAQAAHALPKVQRFGHGRAAIGAGNADQGSGITVAHDLWI